MAGGVFRLGPHVDEIKGFPLPSLQHGLQSGDAQQANAVLFGQSGGKRFGRGQAVGRRLGHFQPIGAGFQLVPRQQPSSRAVLQTADAGQPHALQQTRPDYAARTSRTVHDHRGIGLQPLHDVRDAQGQFSPGHAAPPGDAEALVLFRRAGIDDVQLVAARHACLQVGGLDFRHVVHHFHLFPEILARHVGAPFGGMVLAHPAVDTAFKNRHATVSHALQGCGGQRGAASVVVAYHDSSTRKRHRARHLEFDLSTRQQAHPGDVRAVVFPGLSDVDTGAGGAAFK